MHHALVNVIGPIYERKFIYDLWLLNHTESFPKSERFRMGKRLEDGAFEFYELLIQATRTSKRKRQVLLDADLVLDRLRLYMRLSHARKLTSQGQYEYAAASLTEIGKLLGGWLETVPQA
ncbi:MAG: diversity-generating retroelement protein Avd [Anaerolineae bacterium]